MAFDPLPEGLLSTNASTIHEHIRFYLLNTGNSTTSVLLLGNGLLQLLFTFASDWLQSLLQFLTCEFHKEAETVTVAMITGGLSTGIEIVVYSTYSES